MNDGKRSGEHPRFVPCRGSRVWGQHKDKKQRITEALSDLRLAIAGLASEGDGRRNMSEMVQSTSSLARTCSVFLRKLVLGEARNRGARLLDDSVMESLEMSLKPLRKIPTEGRRTVETGFRMQQVALELTTLDEVTGEPRQWYMAAGGLQGLSILVEWPLLGTTDWVQPPIKGDRWRVSAEQLFDTNSKREMNCDNWLGQQVVVFDGKGITLEKLIRSVVNLEGAHAVNVDRLFVVDGEIPSRAVKEPHIHILRNIAFFGVGYVELVVIEAAMYLFKLLLKEPSIEQPSGRIYLLTPAVECTPEEASSPNPNWLQYRGGLMMSFSPKPGIVRHTVRAPA